MTTTRTTPVLFLASVAVIALHVIDDSFLQPQPGTSAADHLVRRVRAASCDRSRWRHTRVSAAARRSAWCSGSSGSSSASRPCTTRPRWVLPATTSAACSPFRQGLRCSASGWSRSGGPASATTAPAHVAAAPRHRRSEPSRARLRPVAAGLRLRRHACGAASGGRHRPGARRSRTSSSTRATGSPWRARTCRRRTARP